MAREGLGTCVVEVGGNRYDRMLSMNLKASKQDKTPSGTIVLSWPGDYTNQQQMAAPDFLAGAEGRIWLDGQLAATVRFDKRISKGSSKSYELTLNFRGNNAINLDSAVVHETGQFNDEGALAIIRQVMRPGTEVIDRSGGSEPLDRMIVADGERIGEFVARVAKTRSLNLWENPEGQWVLEQLKKPSFSVMPAEFRVFQRIAESQRMAGLPEDVRNMIEGASTFPVGGLTLGRDFTQWQVSMDIRPRYDEMQSVGAGIATDDNYGAINEGLFADEQRQFAQANAEGRQMRMLPDAPHDQQSLDNRTNFDAVSRDRQAVQVTLRMSTWSDNSGNIWKLSDKWHVNIPIDYVDDDLEVTGVEYELTKDSRSATLQLTGEASGAGEYGLFNSQAFASIRDDETRLREERERQPIPPAPETVSP